jgi:predicted nucleotidyltransferase component of viral defense system
MMRRTEPMKIHEDQDLFREALGFSAAKTGFPARLVEKDYYCTLLLEYLTGTDPGLVFKGGTCLAKVHAGFYRLSEDLDFSIAMAIEASRGQPRPEKKPRARIEGSHQRSGTTVGHFQRTCAHDRGKRINPICGHLGIFLSS